MEKDQKFPQQEAPEKNTDDAFVKVGKDGAPVIPEVSNDKEQDNKNPESTVKDH